MRLKTVIIIVLACLWGCKKDAQSFNSDLQGKWELASSYGAWTGHVEYSAGNGNAYTFKGNTFSQQVHYADTTYAYSGTFKTYTGKPCEFAAEQKLIEFSNAGDASSFSLSGDTLFIGTTECIADGGTSAYRKIK